MKAAQIIAALAIAMGLMVPATAQNAAPTPRTGFEIQATITVKLRPLWSKNTYKTQAECEDQRTSDNQHDWADALKAMLERHFGDGNVTIVQVCQPAQDHSNDQ